jgi:MraZ protein
MGPLFSGRFEYTLDEKNRVSLPARYREALGDPVKIWYAMDGQINVSSIAAWQRIAEILSGQNQALRAVRDLTRMVLAADDCPVDKQGRILIQPSLRRDAGLDTNVVIIGMVDHLEIWGLEQWQESQRIVRTERSAVTDELLAKSGLVL